MGDHPHPSLDTFEELAPFDLLLDDLEGAISGSILDDDRFQRSVGLMDEGLQGLRNRGGMVVRANDDADESFHHGVPQSTTTFGRTEPAIAWSPFTWMT